MTGFFAFCLFLSGIAGGVIGGMGLGGGTLLIPLLTIALSVPQKTAAWLNLLCFIPMSVFALAVHSKNKLVSFKDALLFIPFSLCGAFLASRLTEKIGGDVMRVSFGYFLIFLGSFSLVFFLIDRITRNREKR